MCTSLICFDPFIINFCMFVSGVQSRNTPTDIPGQVPARERDSVRAGAAHGQDDRDAPRPAGVATGTFQSRRSEPEEDRAVPLLWRDVLQHSLGQPSPT